jgi:hypothetical protein
MEAQTLSHLKISIEEKLHTVTILKQLLRGYTITRNPVTDKVHIIDKTERRHRTRKQPQTTLHSLLRSERELSLPETLLQCVDTQFLMAIEHNKIMPVALVIPEEKILAMSRIYILPIFECKLNGRKRRMTMSVILYPILLQKSVYLINPGFHLIILTN